MTKYIKDRLLKEYEECLLEMLHEKIKKSNKYKKITQEKECKISNILEKIEPEQREKIEKQVDEIKCLENERSTMEIDMLIKMIEKL